MAFPSRADLDGSLFHDLRRTGVRNLVLAGVLEGAAMAISGDKTGAVFERYNLVSERDLQDAMRWRPTCQTRKGASSGQIVQKQEEEAVAKPQVIN